MRILSYYASERDLVRVLGAIAFVQPLRRRLTCMLSTQICVMVLTLVGVTPGGFNVASDCNVVVNSSSAAMLTSDVTVRQVKRERKA